MLSIVSTYECLLSPPKNLRLQRFFLSVTSFICKYVESLICLWNWETTQQYFFFFISRVIISLYLPNAMRSFSWDVFSVPNFLSQNPLLFFRFLPTFHWFLLETHQRQIFFRRLRFSKVARFFFVFVTKSSVYLSSFYSSTLLSMSSSFLLTSSTLSLWFLSFLPLKYKFSCPSNQ